MKNRFKIACETECVLRSLFVCIFAPKISILRPSWHPFGLLFGTFLEPKSSHIALQDPSEATLVKTLRADPSRRRPRPPNVSQKLSKSLPQASQNPSKTIQKPSENLFQIWEHFASNFSPKNLANMSIFASIFESFWLQNRSWKRNIDFSILAFPPGREH